MGSRGETYHGIGKDNSACSVPAKEFNKFVFVHKSINEIICFQMSWSTGDTLFRLEESNQSICSTSALGASSPVYFPW